MKQLICLGIAMSLFPLVSDQDEPKKKDAKEPPKKTIVQEPTSKEFTDLPEPSKGEPVILPKSVEVKVGRLVKVYAKSSGPVTWVDYPGIRDKIDVDKDLDKSITFVSLVEGDVWIGAYTFVEGKASQPVWMLVKSSATGKANGTEPIPVAPTAKSGSLWIVVVHQPGTEKAWGPQFFSNAALVDRVLDKKHKWKIVDKDGKDSNGNLSQSLAPYVNISQGRKLPWCYLVDSETKTTRWNGAAPKTPEELLKRLVEVGG